MGMDIIRQAVLANRGGLQNATNPEIMTIWRSLDEQTQEKYLQSINKKQIPLEKTKSLTGQGKEGQRCR